MKLKNIKLLILFALVILFQIISCEKSDEEGEGWTEIPGFKGRDIRIIHAFESSIYVAADSIYVSSDDAKTWKSISTGLPNLPYWWVRSFGSLSVNDTTYLFVGTFVDGIYRSADKGLSWQTVYDKDSTFITALGSCEGVIYAAVSQHLNWYTKLCYSTDRGQNWIESAHIQQTVATDFVSLGHTVFISTEHRGVMISRDNGQTWTSTWNSETQTSDVGLFTERIDALTTNGKDIFAIGLNNIYYSTDGGYQWVTVVPESFSPTGNDAAMKDSTIIVYRYVSHNYGRTWLDVSEGLPHPNLLYPYVSALTIFGNKVYFGLGTDGLWVNTSIIKH